MLVFSHAALSDVGLRRSNNEDAALADPVRRIYVLADGMGGHAGGEVASRAAVTTALAALQAGSPMKAAFARADAAVRAHGAADPALHGLGTTLVAATISPDGALAVGHVGDSRAYLLWDDRFTPLTDDHSLGGGTLMYALGYRGGGNPDVTTRATMHAGDVLLLCSDGLHGYVQEARIAAILRGDGSPALLAEQLVAAAYEAGAPDNVTVVVVRAKDGPGRRGP